MLKLASALIGYAIEASDGAIGRVADFLFDDRTWQLRWLVIDTGVWLPGRKVLLHPKAIGGTDHPQRKIDVALTIAQVERSPDLTQHEPVTEKMEQLLYEYYHPSGTHALDDSYFDSHPIVWRYSNPPILASAPAETDRTLDPNVPDNRLRSVITVTGYSVVASDGAIGKIEDFLIEDADWRIGNIVIETGHWWSRKYVLISPDIVGGIFWMVREIRLAATGDQVAASPPWSPLYGGDQS